MTTTTCSICGTRWEPGAAAASGSDGVAGSVPVMVVVGWRAHGEGGVLEVDVARQRELPMGALPGDIDAQALVGPLLTPHGPIGLVMFATADMDLPYQGSISIGPGAFERVVDQIDQMDPGP